MNPTRSRGIILNKIKQALSKKKNNLQEPDFSSPVYISGTEKDLSITFAENLIKTNTQFIFCESEKEFVESLNLVVRKKNLESNFVWEENLIPLIQKAGIKFTSGDNDFIRAEAGITTCEALIARTGSILISSATRSGRRLSIYPPIHIAIGYTSQVVNDIDEGLLMIRKKYEGNIPSMISLVSGPSRTADIEKTLVMGAHGPREVILFLIDDSSSNII